MLYIFDEQTKLRWAMPHIIAHDDLLPKLREQLQDTLPATFFDFFGMTIAEFLRLQENIMPEKIKKLLKSRKTKLFTYVKLINTFEQGAKSFEAFIESTTIDEDDKEREARRGLVEISPEEAMLTLLKDYYNLNSLELAQNMTLYEYITARKITFNTNKFNKNLVAIQKVAI